MNTLWPIIAPYFWPWFFAYFFSGVYYIIRDASQPIQDRPSYLSSSSAISVVGVFWFPILVRVLWRSWHQNNIRNFLKDVRKEGIPTIAVFSLLMLDFIYVRSHML